MSHDSKEHIKVNIRAARLVLTAKEMIDPTALQQSPSAVRAAISSLHMAEDELNKMEPTVTELATEIHDWANATFPDRPTHSAWVKLFEEIGEVIKDPDDPLEWADVFILLMDLTKIHRIDIAGAVRDKIRINRERKWAVDSRGLMSHTSESELLAGVGSPMCPVCDRTLALALCICGWRKEK